MLPFFLRHYRDWVDGFVFFDNASTDRTRELIANEPRAECLPFDSLGYYKVEVHTMIKNKAYRQLRLGADWYLIVDCDEFLWHPNPRTCLERYMREGVTLPQVKAYQMYAETFPADDGATPLVELAPCGIRDVDYDKPLVVHKDVNVCYRHFALGADPRGHVNRGGEAEWLLLRYNVRQLGLAMEDREYEQMRNKDFSRRTSEKIPGIYDCYLPLRRVMTQTEACRLALPVRGSAAKAAQEHLYQEQRQGGVWAQHAFAMLAMRGHLEGVEVPEWLVALREAAQQGEVLALYQAGHLLCEGGFVTQQRELALQCFAKAMQLGHTESAFRAGVMFEQAGQESQARACYVQAAQAGHARAQYKCSAACEREGDTEAMCHWLRLAAEGGFPPAELNYGIYCYNQQRFEEASRWALLNARRGNLKAYELLGSMQESLRGIPGALEDAERWLSHFLRYSITNI